jgi:hypothetical protein
VTARFSTFVKWTYVYYVLHLLKFTTTHEYNKQVSDGKILENNLPVFVITFATQEMLLFRNAKTREIVVGAENKVEQCHYAAVITRMEDDLANELTGGWKVMEVCLSVSVGGVRYRYSHLHRRWVADLLGHICRPALSLLGWTAPSLQYLHVTIHHS